MSHHLDEYQPEHTPRILLIEDDESQAHLLQHLLRRAKPNRFRSESVETLAQGLAALKTGEFDVVIVDLGLPDSRGLETFDVVQAAFPSIPAVVMTGNDDESLAIEAVRRGAQDYIVKGFASEHTIVRSLRYAMERKRLQEQLLQSQKMQAVGSLADGIAHEFNNLLQVIQGYTRYAMEGLPEGEQRYKDLLQVINAAERAASLTEQLLDFGRPHELLKQETSCSVVIGEVAEMIRPLLGEDIRVTLDLDAEADTISADANQLQQLVMNLCINARDAMPNGGNLTLRLATEEIDDQSPIRHHFTDSGWYSVIRVEDSGSGMSEEVQRRLFEPFFTTKDPDKGTGLGLAVVYSIVRQHEGIIVVDSEPEKGTKFSVYFPVYESLKRDVTPDDTVESACTSN